jgi:hypothetical protein
MKNTVFLSKIVFSSWPVNCMVKFNVKVVVTIMNIIHKMRQ